MSRVIPIIIVILAFILAAVFWAIDMFWANFFVFMGALIILYIIVSSKTKDKP